MLLLRFTLVFCQFQPGIAYASATYIKKRVYTSLGCFIRTIHANLIHNIWVDLINEGQQETHGLLGKKANPRE